MDAGVLISIILAVLGIAITVVIWIASTRAVRTTQAQETPGSYLRTVDEDAYRRAREIYEGAIDRAEKENGRLNEQLSFQNDQLTTQSAEIMRLNRENVKLRNRMPSDYDSGEQPRID